MWVYFYMGAFVMMLVVSLYYTSKFYMDIQCKKDKHICYKIDGRSICINCNLVIK